MSVEELEAKVLMYSQQVSKLKGLLGSVLQNISDARDVLEFIDPNPNAATERLNLAIGQINGALEVNE